MIFSQPTRAARNHLIAERIDDPLETVRLVERLDQAQARLAHFPNLGRAGRRAGTRELVLSGTPYLFVYRVDANAVVILDIRHTARKPQLPIPFGQRRLGGMVAAPRAVRGRGRHDGSSGHTPQQAGERFILRRTPRGA